MRLHSIAITNLAAFPAFTATFPAVAIIQGRNGLGKSSLQSVIRYAFGRRTDGSRAVEHDPVMLHGNADKGEAIITFDDGSLLRVLVTRKDTTRQTKPKEGNKWSRSTSEIDALANALSYDPVQFKDFDAKRRVETILRIMPAQVTSEEISAAVGDVAIAFPHDPGLAAINAYHEDIYAMRREENVAADRLTKHAEELEAALGVNGDDRDWETQAKGLRDSHAAITVKEVEHKATVRKTFDAYVAEQKDAHQKAVAASLETMNKAIEKLKAQHGLVVMKSMEEMNAKVEDARKLANQSVTDKRTELAPELDRLTAEIATAEERARAQAQAEGTREAAKKARTEATARKAASARMTDALDRLKALKETVAARLPIKGITIAAPMDGQPVDICREEGPGGCKCGHAVESHASPENSDNTACTLCDCKEFARQKALIPFSRWNETSKLLFCLRIAVLTHGQCGLVCIDSIDAVDPETRKGLVKTMEKYAKAENMQFLLGEATGGELRVAELEG